LLSTIYKPESENGIVSQTYPNPNPNPVFKKTRVLKIKNKKNKKNKKKQKKQKKQKNKKINMFIT
jgi:hypothetical protein